MIKECPVIINNDAVTVVRFGDTDVQLSSIMKDTKTVNVKYENGKYSIVDHVEEAKPVIADVIKTEPTNQIDNDENKEVMKTIKKRHIIDE